MNTLYDGAGERLVPRAELQQALDRDRHARVDQDLAKLYAGMTALHRRVRKLTVFVLAYTFCVLAIIFSLLAVR